MSVIFSSLLLFLHIYAFKVPLLYNSSFLAFALSFIFVRDSQIKALHTLLKSKTLYMLLAIFLFPFFYASISTVLQGEYDFSFLNLAASGVVYSFITLWITSVIYSLNKDRDSIDPAMFIYYIVITQCIIIIFSFFIPSVHEMVLGFQDSTQTMLAESYYGGGVRGLALSGGQFFNLSAFFALGMLISCIYLKKENAKFLFVIISIILLCSLTTGRTVFVGFAFSVFYLLIRMTKTDTIKVYLIISLILTIILFVLTVGLFIEIDWLVSSMDVFYSYSKFAFEFVYNFIETGQFKTASTEHLKTMFFLPDIGTIIFGDGKYTNADGTYYGYTDSGYMRQILLFGLFGLFSFVIFNAWIIRFYSRVFWGGSSTLVFLLVFILLAVLHYKGEIFGYLITVNQTLLFLYFYSFMKESSYVQKKQLFPYNGA